MRLKISHSTTYTYDPPPSGVIQVLRLTPGNHDGQYVADWHVDVHLRAFDRAGTGGRRDADGHLPGPR